MKFITKNIINIVKYILILTILWVGYFIVYGNFHKVDKDIYRSAQLFSFNYPYFIEKHKIRSILNLRDEPKGDWYKTETEVSNTYNINLYNYPISAQKVLSKQTMNDILQIIKTAPKPLLIHCKAGADRTSLAVALYLHNKGKKNANNALSLIYGHFPWLGSKTDAMDKSFDIFKSLN